MNPKPVCLASVFLIASLAASPAIAELIAYFPFEEGQGTTTVDAVKGVATFYDQFRFEPMGRNVLRVCHGTACHVKGSQVLQNAIDDHLGIPEGRDTDPDGHYTVQKVACLGCCTLAPVVQSENATFGNLTPASVGGLLDDVERAAAGGAAQGFDGLAARGAVQGEPSRR